MEGVRACSAACSFCMGRPGPIAPEHDPAAGLSYQNEPNSAEMAVEFWCRRYGEDDKRTQSCHNGSRQRMRDLENAANEANSGSRLDEWSIDQTKPTAKMAGGEVDAGPGIIKRSQSCQSSGRSETGWEGSARTNPPSR
jgi:hypothetical protein